VLFISVRFRGNFGNYCEPYEEGSKANGGVCGRCVGSTSLGCRNGLCSKRTLLLLNKVELGTIVMIHDTIVVFCVSQLSRVQPPTNIATVTKPSPSNPTKYPALIPDTASVGRSRTTQLFKAVGPPVCVVIKVGFIEEPLDNHISPQQEFVRRSFRLWRSLKFSVQKT